LEILSRYNASPAKAPRIMITGIRHSGGGVKKLIINYGLLIAAVLFW